MLTILGRLRNNALISHVQHAGLGKGCHLDTTQNNEDIHQQFHTVRVNDLALAFKLNF